MIFPYHRVLETEDPLTPGSPGARNFERQLRRISKYCNPLTLDDAIERLKHGSLPPRAVSVTFDDGYANNLRLLVNRYNKVQPKLYKSEAKLTCPLICSGDI